MKMKRISDGLNMFFNDEYALYHSLGKDAAAA